MCVWVCVGCVCVGVWREDEGGGEKLIFGWYGIKISWERSLLRGNFSRWGKMNKFLAGGGTPPTHLNPQ